MIFITIVIGATILVLLWLIRRAKDQAETSEQQSEVLSSAQSENGSESKESSQKVKTEATAEQKKKKGNQQAKRNPNTHQQFTHPQLITTLKGHSGLVTSGDFSANGRHFISAAEDRIVLFWSTKEFGQKSQQSVRGNIEFDHATKVCWSPDSKAFIIQAATANCIQVYKLTKNSTGGLGTPSLALTFPQHSAEADVIALGFAVSGRFIMTLNSRSQLVIWDLRGNILEEMDVRHGDTYHAQLSTCGRFIITSGFTPDAKVWEVKFNKSGNYEGIKRAFILSGHTSGIYSSTVNADSSRMATVSKDGSWRLYDTKIEYDKGQSPYLLLSGKYERKETPGIIKLSPDSRTIAIAAHNDIYCYSAINGEQLNYIHNIYEGSIVDVLFDPSSKFLLTLGDKHIRVFHNVAGYMAALQDLEQSRLKASNAGMRERIDGQIQEAKLALQQIQQITALE
ncbi:unnamed protein product [Meganyctiphanes norvegica]|uniref:Transducin beta-like protein 2 n=1 Tax=Meganyctiphanes norvegica TaxID=48144 RepID=A0AAV2RB46_MEGNR